MKGLITMSFASWPPKQADDRKAKGKPKEKPKGSELIEEVQKATAALLGGELSIENVREGKDACDNIRRKIREAGVPAAMLSRAEAALNTLDAVVAETRENVAAAAAALKVEIAKEVPARLARIAAVKRELNAVSGRLFEESEKENKRGGGKEGQSFYRENEDGKAITSAFVDLGHLERDAGDLIGREFEGRLGRVAELLAKHRVVVPEDPEAKIRPSEEAQPLPKSDRYAFLHPKKQHEYDVTYGRVTGALQEAWSSGGGRLGARPQADLEVTVSGLMRNVGSERFGNLGTNTTTNLPVILRRRLAEAERRGYDLHYDHDSGEGREGSVAYAVFELAFIDLSLQQSNGAYLADRNPNTNVLGGSEQPSRGPGQG
ncbi:hypothetical protein [Streptomyces fuscichromogenes]|uniref:Uncharacterized protein n=1 Tax=Streptomyces fuscichromogenes TaxID=1324013 RepID=A0A917XEJ9_9ACTN|nr:hypothetical protein [Streptomyces fuscichromogenes]GGN16235.1 hypothetical protein GCM10011578_044620 [Streptomyces fuscichromogenes]